ncbi:hypothetical protein BHE74_00033026 [Ensete ventricosum]|nr:hypothetical protein GW17_00027957 [Ensete ventricosum]RWW60008.1 hypothetical protein BHE74_00033026 [Ensete ventricosum]
MILGPECALACGRSATSPRACTADLLAASKISGSEMATLRRSPRYGRTAVTCTWKSGATQERGPRTPPPT